MLEVYGHGGDLETASLRYGIAPGEFIDFSANINPLGPPPGLLDRLRDALPGVVSYPDPGHRTLTLLLAKKNNVDKETIVIGNGAAENMALALLALSPKVVGIVEPCFSEYATLSKQFGAEVRSVFGTEERAFKAEPADVERLIGESDLVFIGQPNNPNGVQYGLDELRLFAEAGERHKTYVVLDEAFVDFIPDTNRQSLLSELERYRYLILIRSMTKFYAIPGLRLGYAMAHPQLAAMMRDKQVTWSVNLLALIAGEYCLSASEEYEAATIALVAQQREFLRDRLSRLGCMTWPSEGNFLLVRLPQGWSAKGMQEALGRRGILVRSCAMYPGLSDRDIRIAVKGNDDNCKLLTEMERVVGGVL
ncbi:pyridoxal phosphate-dependent class II aminotransferase [Paenibacillus anaericanus]|uniref:Aminotransferase n=1 Tax=Paenibacillus anaericanus TaxID=170367 RepID=A0A3S1DQ00_9BACL|nr:threonine-phosphate decarboxylase [Paenibacillus anaericanus]RUT46397.1 pyridoxal phosphate-dependent class II aminotransferase [Paenibacillus anaericanus]